MKKSWLIWRRAFLWGIILTSVTFSFFTLLLINITGEAVYHEPNRLIAIGEAITLFLGMIYAYYYAFTRGMRSTFEDERRQT